MWSGLSALQKWVTKNQSSFEYRFSVVQEEHERVQITPQFLTVLTIDKRKIRNPETAGRRSIPTSRER